MKNSIRITVVAAIAAIAGYGVYTSQKSETMLMSDLTLANVEALAGGETSTSWHCKGWWGDCYAYCGLCNTKIEGDGEVTGTHSCSGISQNH